MLLSAESGRKKPAVIDGWQQSFQEWFRFVAERYPTEKEQATEACENGFSVGSRMTTDHHLLMCRDKSCTIALPSVVGFRVQFGNNVADDDNKRISVTSEVVG